MAVGLVLVLVAVVGRNDDDGGTAASGASSTTSSSAVAFVDPARGDVASGTTAPVTSAGLGRGTAPERRGRHALRGFSEMSATITSGSGETCEVCLLAATTEAQRERGLMEVTDRTLGGYDGMVFVYPQAIDGAFWMRNTPQPLSIAYFDAKGKLVSTADMAPCEDSTSCPNYPAKAPFRYALEVPKGMLDDLKVTGAASIHLRIEHCPLASAS